jgi:subtilisin family serine protease
VRTSLITLICIALSSILFSQQITDAQHSFTPKNHVLLEQSDLISIPPDLESKILSGILVRNISEKKYLHTNGLLTEADAREMVVIYVNDYPSAEQIADLESLGVKCYVEIWTPPLDNHPYGYFLAEVPVNKFTEALTLTFIKKLDTAEYENFPHNNAGVISINADDVWLDGYDGTGVKVAVLDSGIDTFYDGTEFPTSFERMDYSNYPTLDENVENSATGHGTHVAGTVLGRGMNSIGRSNEGNGSTPFKGSAPGANLTFLKIGLDGNGSATSNAMIAAMDAAVNIYDADVLSMSYGGWHTYHDGSESLEQKVDWVYSQGVPFFISAGNSAADGQHYSGTVGANTSTDFIPINANVGALLSFNLVWYDGLGTRNDLSLEYYNTSQIKYTTNITQNSTTESVRGTESKYSWRNLSVAAGTYYLKVVNNSPSAQFFHIYFDRQTTPVLSFASPDPNYTIGQPASADNGFAVGSYVSRDIWVASNNSSYWFGSTFVLNNIAPYSSRGPRVNGGVTKPNISAPGSAIISIRDTDVLTSIDPYWIDNDGTLGGNANYYVMQGTSMATPLVAGSVALILQKFPGVSPLQIYDAIQNNAVVDALTGSVPNNTWGYGKLDILAASEEPLPVELSSFSASLISSTVKLSWQTATEINNYGFDIERCALSAERQAWNKIGFVNGNGNSNSTKSYSYEDKNVTPGKHSYRLKQIDNDGKFEYSKSIEVDMNGVNKFELSQNYPNPFNPTTTIRFNLPEAGNVKLTLFNILGQEIKTLVNEVKEAGTHTINFNAGELNSGMYIYKIEAGSFVQTRKMTLVK